MKKFFVDLHVHIGRSADGSPVKITAAKNLTVENILNECMVRKGIDIVGIIDSSSPRVQNDLAELIDSKRLSPMDDGGLCYKNSVSLILGAEIETTDRVKDYSGRQRDKSAHCLCYFPHLENVADFTKEISKVGRVKNPNLSSQKCNLPMDELCELVDGLGGFVIPAHSFTPHKGVYGSCVKSIREILKQKTWDKIPAIELGLSSDSSFADMISELADKTFLSNSDAHSLPKIGREYNVFMMEKPTYKELLMALQREGGRRITGNYGFDPRLGKYHRTYCEVCRFTAEEPPPVSCCTLCGNAADGRKVIMGVLDRIYLIRDNDGTNTPLHRPPYYHQIPLENLPGIGKKTLEKLLKKHTEMEIIHYLSETELEKVAGRQAARTIVSAREGKLEVTAGGGGHYGRVKIGKGG